MMAIPVGNTTSVHVDTLDAIFKILRGSGLSPDDQFAVVGAIVTSFARMTTTPEAIMAAFIETLEMRLEQMRGEA